MTKRRATVTSIEAGGHRSRVIQRRDRLVEQHLELVPPIAKKIHKSLPPSFDLEDLIATGNLGLLRAATRYRPKQHSGTPFSAYARHRIRGAILDSIKRRHYVEQTRPSIEDPVFQTRVEQRVGAMLECDPGPLQRRVARDIASPEPSVETQIDRARLLAKVTKALGELSEIQLNVLNKYYTDDLDALTHMHWKRRQIVARMHDEILRTLRRELAS